MKTEVHSSIVFLSRVWAFLGGVVTLVFFFCLYLDTYMVLVCTHTVHHRITWSFQFGLAWPSLVYLVAKLYNTFIAIQPKRTRIRVPDITLTILRTLVGVGIHEEAYV